jgi:hypothetical protein
MNRKIGMLSSAVTFLAVAAFALSMLLGNDQGSYLSSMFIAWGFIPMACAFAACADEEARAAANAGVAFAAIYGLLIFVVYFTQLTAVRLSALSAEALEILDYKRFGLFFSLDLLGYAFMALSTFFIGLTLKPVGRPDRWLKSLLLIHGVFAVSCVVIPMLGVFKPGMAGGDLTGVLVLEFWCAYFLPVSALAYRFFKRRGLE